MNNNKSNKPAETPKSKCDVVKIGIDVHAQFLVATRQFDRSKAQPAQKFLTRDFLPWIQKQFELADKVTTCYEAGPTGFWLHRQLTQLGVTNYVLCPTALDSRNRGVNTDQTDSSELLSRLDRFLAGNSRAISIVRVPTLEQEQKRAVTRQREQLRRTRLSMAAQGRTLMLLHGFRRSNHWWKQNSWNKLLAELPAWIIERLEIFRKLFESLDSEVKALTGKISKAAGQSKPLGESLNLGRNGAQVALLQSPILRFAQKF